jgi:hypothetical protein
MWLAASLAFARLYALYLRRQNELFMDVGYLEIKKENCFKPYCEHVDGTHIGMPGYVKMTHVVLIVDSNYDGLYAICLDIVVCRMCFVGARYGHFPAMLSHINIKRFTPTPALVFLVRSLVKENVQIPPPDSDRTGFKVCITLYSSVSGTFTEILVSDVCLILQFICERFIFGIPLK